MPSRLHSFDVGAEWIVADVSVCRARLLDVCAIGVVHLIPDLLELGRRTNVGPGVVGIEILRLGSVEIVAGRHTLYAAR